MGTGGRRSKSAAARASKTPALDTLRVEEQAGVLELLLRSAPRLATDAERIARELLADTSVETVAEEVEWGLRSREADELQGRAGRQRYGYVEPTEAAWEILGEELDPLLSWAPTYQPITPTDRSVCCARPESTFPRASSRSWRRSGQAELERSGLTPD